MSSQEFMISGLRGLGSEGSGLGMKEPNVNRGVGLGAMVVVRSEESPADGGGSRVNRP